MRQAHLSTKFAAIVSAMSLITFSPVFGAEGDSGGGASNTGDVFADLIVAWRDVDGVPKLTSFPVLGESGIVDEQCVQPISYAPLPGLSSDYTIINEVDGREAYRIPLLGETLADGEAAIEGELEVCDPQPAYGMYVSEAELERLNMARQPDDVKNKKLEEVELRLLSADEITLDGAGRITTDGVAIDAAPDHAAIYGALMATGTIPGLPTSPAQVRSWDTLMLAAAAVGTASGKSVPLTVDSIQYYNRIVEVPANYRASPDWEMDFLQTQPSNGELFVNYRNFRYTRSDVFTGCVTWLDVASLKWMVSPILDVVEFGELPPIATNGEVRNLAGFTQLADDVRATILYLHANEVIPGFFMDPVGENSCDAQLNALTQPAVHWDALPTDIIQTDTVTVDASVYMPWMGTTVDHAQVRITVEATEPAASFTADDQVIAEAAAGTGVGEFVDFSVDTDTGSLVGVWGPPAGFAVDPGYHDTTSFDVIVAADAPTGLLQAEPRRRSHRRNAAGARLRPAGCDP